MKDIIKKAFWINFPVFIFGFLTVDFFQFHENPNKMFFLTRTPIMLFTAFFLWKEKTKAIFYSLTLSCIYYATGIISIPIISKADSVDIQNIVYFIGRFLIAVVLLTGTFYGKRNNRDFSNSKFGCRDNSKPCA